MTYVCIACVVGNVSDNVSYIVPGSSEHRELWMVRLREVILLLLAMLSVLMGYSCVTLEGILQLTVMSTPYF